ncbi:hypothetical protein [Dermatobacter hominis]|uniref:hypothetical protein n=1 Tax=Dermatobacter hominis TaxID=2884263 RepID=UPI001D103F1A|nr:hypothetical protein [Dermatobacter hominis]UDY34684.1 hypothetical protein LH044_15245 [Dermatobacter hominis]
MIESEPATAAAFDRLAETFGDVLTRGQMMGRPCLFLADGGRRRMLACLDAEVLGVRLGRTTDAFADALALPGASVFSPGSGRKQFKDWVGLPAVASERWEPLVAQALESAG